MRNRKTTNEHQTPPILNKTNNKNKVTVSELTNKIGEINRISSNKTLTSNQTQKNLSKAKNTYNNIKYKNLDQ